MKMFILLVAVINIFASDITKSTCEKSKNFIYTHKECIEIREFKEEKKNTLNIVLHGIWGKNSNTIGKYSSFGEDLSINSETTTIIVAMPGYSKSSHNHIKPFYDGKLALAASREYLNFVQDLIKTLKNKYKIKNVNIIAHSASAMISATLSALNHNLAQKYVLIGGRYNVHKKLKAKNLISVSDVMNKINKNTKYLLIAGTKDKISPMKITKDFYKKLKLKNINAKLKIIKNARHAYLDMQEESMNAIVDFIE